MKLRKLMLPMMAFVCAISLAFTTVPGTEMQTSGEIFRDGTWQAVPVSCTGDEDDCQVRFTSEPGQVYDVYSSMDHSLKLRSSNGAPFILND